MASSRSDDPSGPTPPAPHRSSAGEVAAFLNRARAPAPAGATPGARGRLIFAMDATASREPTWDSACRFQGEMFDVARDLGGLAVQLVWYRGIGEFSASGWRHDAVALRTEMTRVACRGGHTQFHRVLRHALTAHASTRIDALVFVGDCLEEPVDPLYDTAGRLALKGVPVFIFHEGEDPVATNAFRRIATLTRGACARLDAGSAAHLRDLMAAVAAYAAGGRDALNRLARRRGADVRRLSRQME